MTVLLAYASKHGSTEGIARGIAERLGERGMDADARPIGEVNDLGDPEAVVLGSAVYVGSWMKEASAFIERHREELSRIPVWLFSSWPTGTEPTDVGVSEKQLAALQPIAPRDHRPFYGALDPSKLGFLERKMVKAVKAPVGLPRLGRDPRLRRRDRRRPQLIPPFRQPSFRRAGAPLAPNA
ncbi:MAG: flavodoxin domain-containing protein [Actinobacteria bacterium]|nr:flavodoxin domain-containing protein [Actinomycetota bacterium]